MRSGENPEVSFADEGVGIGVGMIIARDIGSETLLTVPLGFDAFGSTSGDLVRDSSGIDDCLFGSGGSGVVLGLRLSLSLLLSEELGRSLDLMDLELNLLRIFGRGIVEDRFKIGKAFHARCSFCINSKDRRRRLGCGDRTALKVSDMCDPPHTRRIDLELVGFGIVIDHRMVVRVSKFNSNECSG